MGKSTFPFLVISFGLVFACVIEANEDNFQDETSHLLWPRKLLRGAADPPRAPHEATISGGVTPVDPPRGPHEATLSSGVTPVDPPRGPHEATISGGVTPAPWSPSQRLVFRMLPKNVPIPPSGPSPHPPPRTV
ncbi:hypothetical protein Bca101_024717 [Brassica carinata]